MQESSVDRMYTASHNLWVLFAVIVLDLGACMLIPVQGGKYWPVAVLGLAFHIPSLAFTGFFWRTGKPSRFLFAAVAVAVLSPSLTIALVIGVTSHKSFGSAAFWIWLIFSLAASPVLFSVLCKERKQPLGACPNCGYSLKGLTTSTCPECGTLQSTQHPTT